MDFDEMSCSDKDVNKTSRIKRVSYKLQDSDYEYDAADTDTDSDDAMSVDNLREHSSEEVQYHYF
jgi:hypothetical protein